MNESIYQPLPTCEIPMPILDRDVQDLAQETLPRILLQAAGSGSANKKVLYLAAFFGMLALLELALLLHTPRPEPIVVYGEAIRPTLVELKK